MVFSTLIFYINQPMGFEEVVPPVPDRLAEIQMLNRLE